jgi:serine/threonine-protein kinase
MIGTTIANQYEVVGKLGEGGFGVVYVAKQLSVGREVAIKVLNFEGANRPDILRRFEAEATITSSLRHPNTIRLIDFGRLPDGRPYLVTERLRGETLETALAEAALPAHRVLTVLRDVCAALEEAHEHQIVHRDLKPGNIFLEMVGRREMAKVLDFGIAKVLDASNVTTRGVLLGTTAYMAPEQVRGHAVDGRTDLYSLGVVAYHALAGHPPFEGKSAWATMRMHEIDPPPPLEFPAEPKVRDALERLVMDMLAKAPELRPASASRVLSRLDAVLALDQATATEVGCAFDPTVSMNIGRPSKPAELASDQAPPTSTPASVVRPPAPTTATPVTATPVTATPATDTPATPAAMATATPKPARSKAPPARVPMTLKIVGGLLVVAGSAALTAFGTGKPERPVSVTVALSPEKVSYAPSDQPALRATVRDAHGRTLVVPVSWKVTPAEFARVEGEALTLLQAGQGVVEACAEAVCGRVEVRGTGLAP